MSANVPTFSTRQIEDAILSLPLWLFDGTRGRGMSHDDTQTDHRVRAMQLAIIYLQGQMPVRMVRDDDGPKAA